MTEMEIISCDLCGSDDHAILFVKEGFQHVRCSHCGLVFVNPRLTRHLDGQVFSGTAEMTEDHLTESQRRRLRKQIDKLEKFRKLNTILEIGPGKGWFLDEAGRAGRQTWAVEVNKSAIHQLRSKGVDHIIDLPAEDFSVEPDSMDVIRMWDVIEHLQSPRLAIENVHRALRPGGLLLLATTNFASLSMRVNGPEWVYLNGSDHIVLFEPATIRALLESAGFVRIKISTRSFNLRRKLYHPEIVLPCRYPFLRPLRKIIDELIRFTPYGHQMIVHAEKSE